jgi:TolA-binding protein
MLTQIKITAAIVAVLLGLLGVQHMMYRSAIKKSATLEAANKNLHQVNQENVADKARMRSEISAMESAMAQMASEQERIIEAANKNLRDKEQELSKLRESNENVSDFLSVPVPADFIGWLRETNRQDPDRPD